MLHVHFFVEEEGSTFAELGGRLGGEILAGATSREPLVHVGMAAQIVLKAGGDVLTLGNEFYS